MSELGGIAADRLMQRVEPPRREPLGEAIQDFGDEPRPAIDEPAIDLHQAGAGADLEPGRLRIRHAADADEQFVPRVNLAYQLSDTTQLRASWGEFQQAQSINELQVEDGVGEFQPTQRADMIVLGLEQSLPADHSLRIEAYEKNYRALRPRYENLLDPLSMLPELRWDRVRIAPDSARAIGVEALLSR